MRVVQNNQMTIGEVDVSQIKSMISSRSFSTFTSLVYCVF